MSSQRLEAARKELEFAELSEHNFDGNELPGFYAGWSIAASGNLDLCQGVVDRLNELLAAGNDRSSFALGKLAGYAAYHRELITLLSKGN